MTEDTHAERMADVERALAAEMAECERQLAGAQRRIELDLAVELKVQYTLDALRVVRRALRGEGGESR